MSTGPHSLTHWQSDATYVQDGRTRSVFSPSPRVSAPSAVGYYSSAQGSDDILGAASRFGVRSAARERRVRSVRRSGPL